jgi:hypothetical protein
MRCDGDEEGTWEEADAYNAPMAKEWYELSPFTPLYINLYLRVYALDEPQTPHVGDC